MTGVLGLKLPWMQTFVGGVTGVCTCSSICPAVAGVKKWNNGGKALRRMVLGGGSSFLLQLMRTAGNVSSRSFDTSGRIKGSSSVDELLKNVEWPEQFPFKEEDFQRFDESPDFMFYEEPTFVTQIDDPAIAALTKYYSKVFPPSSTPGVSILDMCSSWVSVDYLTKPLDVFKETCRILKPGGLAIISFSNRLVFAKAISSGHQLGMPIMLRLWGHISITLEDLNLPRLWMYLLILDDLILCTLYTLGSSLPLERCHSFIFM